jgi:spore maturation protein CgeB
MFEHDVLITGGTPDCINTNKSLRRHVVRGFEEILGPRQVVHVPLEVAQTRIRISRPALVLVFGSCLPDQCEYSGLRRACDQIGSSLAFWLHDDPYEFDANAKIVSLADYIFSNDRWAAEHYHRNNVCHVPLAACRLVHQTVAADRDGVQRTDVFFCGVAYESRVRLLTDLRPVLDRVHTEIYGEGWNSEQLRFCQNVRLPFDELPKRYAASAVVLNMGRDFHYANRKYHLAPSTPGPRTFEAAMAGACQMIFADSLEVLDYFQVGEEILLFNEPAEFERLLMQMIEQPQARARIGAAARSRCLREHTYAARARKILGRVGIEITNSSALERPQIEGNHQLAAGV